MTRPAGHWLKQHRQASLRALSLLNFSLADVRDGLGPFLGIFLVAMGWAPDEIGFVMTVGGLTGMLATTPMGALVDHTRRKRLLVAACAMLIILVNMALLIAPTPWVAGLSQIATGIAAAAIGPAIIGLTLGLVGQAGLARQLGRNEAWNHAGNAAAAVLAGVLGYYAGVSAVFYLMSVLALLSIILVLRIDPQEIDHDAARGLSSAADGGKGATASALAVLTGTRGLLVVAVTLMFFHLGNAAMLPLLGQEMAARNTLNPTVYTAATVVIAQMTMIPVALAAARWAELRGYAMLFLLALLVLPVRGLLAAYAGDVWMVVPVQMLDGIGAGLLGIATPGIVARILDGTGRVNTGLGAVMTLQGIGAALSPTFAGLIAAHFGYSAAFLGLSAVAFMALAVWVAFRPSIDAPATAAGPAA